MRLLITGASGQIGRAVTTAFSDHDVLALDHGALDVTERDSVLAAVTTIEPDAIVHAAAWTDVDACESDPDRAFATNALGPRHIAEAAERAGAFVCGLSTDFVFSGEQREPYREWDAPDPLSVYGRSKLAGEHELTRTTNSATVRVALVFSEFGTNLVTKIVKLARDHRVLTFVDDQRSSPTSATDAARMIYQLVTERRPGLFHVTNQGTASPYEFARAVLEAVGDDPARVEPCATAELDPPRAARRPTNSVLDNMMLRLSGIELLPEYRESLSAVVRALTA